MSAGGTRILQMVDLTLHPGEMCALIGPSGAGKSTLIKALLGLRDPDKGSVMMGSLPMAELGPVGYVPQDDALHRGLTVRRELAYAAELRMPEASAEERQSRIAEVLDQVDLGDRAEVRIRRLSGGQRKRVSLALELLTGPPLLILDEPTSGLDPGLEARTMTLLSQVAGTGRIVLVATHAMGEHRAGRSAVRAGGRTRRLSSGRPEMRSRTSGSIGTPSSSNSSRNNHRRPGASPPTRTRTSERFSDARVPRPVRQPPGQVRRQA